MQRDDQILRYTRRRWLTHCTALGIAPQLALASLISAPAVVQAAAKKRETLILVVGDSLSAEYGLKRGSGWVALLEARLTREKMAVTVVNASISGDTTAGGRARLPALLAQRPDIVVLELGANDALRGLPLGIARDNLDAMTTAAKAVGANVVIAGMQMPPNYGQRYGEEFTALFAQVAKARGASLVPFLLKGVADVPQAESLFQADRIHPTAAAHPAILDNIWPAIEPLLKR